MNQTYVYRKHLRAPIQYLILMLFIIFFGIAIMALGLILTGEDKMIGLKLIALIFILLVTAAFVSIESVVLYHVILKRFKSISITLTEDAIVYTNSKGQIIIPYEDIEKLEFPSIKYTGGWMKIIYRGGNIRLTVVLEQIGEFICELKEKLNDRELGHVYNEKKMFSFFKTAVFSDESWGRVYANYKVQVVIHYLCIILTTAMLLLYNDTSNHMFYIFGSLGAPFLGYLISEIIIGIKVKKRVDREELRLLPRNVEFEQKVFRISILGFSIGYLLILLIVMQF